MQFQLFRSKILLIKLAVSLAEQGIVCMIFDMRGFGYSGGIRRNGRFKYFIQDLHRIIEHCEKDMPLFLYGHSLGAAVVCYYLMLNKIRIAGVIFTAPMLQAPHIWNLTRFKLWCLDTFGGLFDVCDLLGRIWC